MKNIVVIVIVIVIILGGIWYFASNKTSENVIPVPESTVPESSGTVPEQQAENVVVATGSGFSPSVIMVNQGETVKFGNGGSQPVWVASAIHPTHTVYPNSDIAKCNTPQAENMFDACKGVAPGEVWSFKFDAKGTWGYHDHLNPSSNGKVIVE